MLPNIAVYVLFFSDILSFSLELETLTEPNEIGLEDSRTRALRDLKKRKKVKPLVEPFPVEPITELEDVVTSSIGVRMNEKSAYETAYNDPEWKYQWYMHDYRTKLGPVMDLNVVPVHRMGITGKGIYVAIVDTGVEMNHPDLQENLAQELSYSVHANKKGSAEPESGMFHAKDNHGTKTAGVIGMTANNSICGVGMAFDAKLVAINRKAFFQTDKLNARALSHERNTVDIYCNSWGPKDSGEYMKATGKLLTKTFDDGVKYGRHGLGSIYTFAGGNGRKSNDNCAADDIVNHIHTIGITGASAAGKRGDYSESCTALYATTYLGGVTSTALNGECTNHYDGTSAATPQASAIIALVLQANNELTYRDVMHLITMGSEVAPLADNDSWYKNGAGFWVSNEFGFGLMNALNMVNLARKWTNVPEKTMCKFEFKIEEDLLFRMNQPAKIKQIADGCQHSENPKERVFYLEQVMMTTSIKHVYRGALSIILTSPAGTESEMLTPRVKDTSRGGLKEWNIKSLHNWGEDPNGEWQMVVNAHFSRKNLHGTLMNLYQTFIQLLLCRLPDYSETGRVVALTLWFHGTSDQPDHHAKGMVPRTYSAFRTANGKTSDMLLPLSSIGVTN